MLLSMRPIFLLTAMLSVPSYAQHAAEAAGPSPDMALKMLLDGNQRYVAGRLARPHQDITRRVEIAKGQAPFAAVLSCADSRVPPEMVFDEGLGDLFTVRVAGNVATDDVVASLEYAVAHTGAKLILVLGHERCGAVDATLTGVSEGHLSALIDRIKPAALAVKSKPGDTLELAIRQNVVNVVKQLQTTQPILAQRAASGAIKIMGARYDLDRGVVEILK